MSTTQTDVHIHAFEQAGLGIAPFKAVSVWNMPSRSLLEHNPEAWNNAIRTAPCSVGSCHYCGHAIVVHYIIKSSDGKIFAVGSECVAKTGEKGLINKARQLKNQLDKEIRHAKREEERLDRLDAERLRNGGLTDYELECKRREDLEKARLNARKPIVDLLLPLAERLMDGANGFRDSVAAVLSRGELPYGRGKSITLDILAKQCGRSNSKAYAAEYEFLEKIFDKAENLIKKL